jgi:hypothetical protein
VLINRRWYGIESSACSYCKLALVAASSCQVVAQAISGPILTVCTLPQLAPWHSCNGFCKALAYTRLHKTFDSTKPTGSLAKRSVSNSMRRAAWVANSGSLQFMQLSQGNELSQAVVANCTAFIYTDIAKQMWHTCFAPCSAKVPIRFDAETTVHNGPWNMLTKCAETSRINKPQQLKASENTHWHRAMPPDNHCKTIRHGHCGTLEAKWIAEQLRACTPTSVMQPPRWTSQAALQKCVDTCSH